MGENGGDREALRVASCPLSGGRRRATRNSEHATEVMTNQPLEGDIRVDVTAIEKSLSELWRAEKKEGDHAVTRAALWNVVAHTSTSDHHAVASETLCRASAAVPQRTIVVRANPSADADLASWISANCHRIGGGQQ